MCPNLKESSLVGRRLVYDAIKCVGGHLKVIIDPEMLKSVRAASRRYRSAREQNQVEKDQELLTHEKRKRHAQEKMEELQAKKQALQSESNANLKKIMVEIVEIQKVVDS